MTDTAVTSLEPVSGLPLTDIFLGHTQVGTLAPLSKVKTLEGVDFLPKNYPQADIDNLRASHPKLRVSRM